MRTSTQNEEAERLIYRNQQVRLNKVLQTLRKIRIITEGIPLHYIISFTRKYGQLNDRFYGNR